MEEYKQENIIIGEIDIPIIKEGEEYWYPIRLISEKILLKKGSILNTNIRSKLGDNYKAFNIDYGINTGGIQLVGCTNKIGWSILISSFKTGGYNLKQKQGYNDLIKYFKFNYVLLPEFDVQDIKLNKEDYFKMANNYNTYIQDCINKVLEDNDNIMLRYCSQCGRLFPLHKMFYNKDQCNKTLIHKCKECQGNNFVLDKKSSKAYNHNKNLIEENKIKFKEEIYLEKDNSYINYKNHNTIAIYDEWKNSGFKGNILEIINNKEGVLYSKKYYANLWQWINEIYPYRDEFDSDDEMYIDKVLHNNFKNIIYNQRNTERTIEIKGMIPDWILFTNNNCWLIEYFGLYVNKNTDNKRICEYKVRADKKIIKYKNLKGYKSLFLYPEDLENNFEKLNIKLKEIY